MGNPAYLDPSVMIMLAAFDTLARERQKGGTTEGRSAPSDDSRAPGYPIRRTDSGGWQGMLAWLKSMLAFHGKKL